VGRIYCIFTLSGRKYDEGGHNKLILKMAKPSAILFGLGLLLHLFCFDLERYTYSDCVAADCLVFCMWGTISENQCAFAGLADGGLSACFWFLMTLIQLPVWAYPNLDRGTNQLLGWTMPAWAFGNKPNLGLSSAHLPLLPEYRDAGVASGCRFDDPLPQDGMAVCNSNLSIWPVCGTGHFNE